MYEYTCAYCGKVVQVKFPSQVQNFCSKSCAASYGNELRGGSPKNNYTGECIFQPESIECHRMDCNDCGWNPEVAKERLAAIMEVWNESTV